MHGSRVASITAETWASISRSSVLYTYGGSTISPRHPASSAMRASSTPSPVDSAAMPATTAVPGDRQRPALARGAERDDAAAPGADHPAAVLGEEAMVDGALRGER